MDVSQYHFTENCWKPALPTAQKADLVLAFGCREAIGLDQQFPVIEKAFPDAEIVGCTTSGEILDSQVYDNTLVLTAISFSSTGLSVYSENIRNFENSQSIGKSLAEKLEKQNLRLALIFSDGQLVNGSDLVDGLSKHLPKDLPISGGLAGDDDRFEQTVVWHNKRVEPGLVVVCGLYGDALEIGHGCLGGWSPLGPNRFITSSDNNVLYELDGLPALDLYRTFLGDLAEELPGSALRFPLSLTQEGEKESVVRTILNIDEETKSMTFAGNMPTGAKVQLMKASFDALVEGANNAAINARDSLGHTNVSLALFISCVGRRLVLGQRVFEELEAAKEQVGAASVSCGFYSYGEISPLVESPECRLHNQTMTITTLNEKMP